MLLKESDCELCVDGGHVAFVTAVESGLLFLVCDFCGVAWRDPEHPEKFEVMAADLAPGGWRFASREEVARVGLEGLVCEEREVSEDDSFDALPGFRR